MKKFLLIIIFLSSTLFGNLAFAVIHSEFVGVCGTTLTASAMCRTTPAKFQVIIYEMGMCSSNPYGTTTSGAATFDASTCTKTFENATGFTTDAKAALDAGVATTMTGTSFRPDNGTYKYPYMWMSKTMTTKGTYTVGATTYYNKNDGVATTNSALYADYAEDLTSFGAGCDPYYINSPTDIGTISAYLTTSASTKTVDTTAGGGVCANATRLMGIMTLTTPIVITPRSVGFTFTFNLTNNGLQVEADGASNPSSFGSGPFSGVFTVTNN
jgi:hypothetical protein